MLDKDNIISASVSDPVEKIPADEKDYRKCSFTCFTLYSHSMQRPTLYSHSIKRADQHRANIEIVTRMHPV